MVVVGLLSLVSVYVSCVVVVVVVVVVVGLLLLVSVYVC